MDTMVQNGGECPPCSYIILCICLKLTTEGGGGGIYSLVPRGRASMVPYCMCMQHRLVSYIGVGGGGKVYSYLQ